MSIRFLLFDTVFNEQNNDLFEGTKPSGEIKHVQKTDHIVLYFVVYTLLRLTSLHFCIRRYGHC